MTENGAKCYKPQLYRGLNELVTVFSTGFSTASVNRTFRSWNLRKSSEQNRPGSNLFQPLGGISIPGEIFLIGAKFGSVDQDPAIVNAGLMFYMEHFMEHDVIQDKPRHPW